MKSVEVRTIKRLYLEEKESIQSRSFSAINFPKFDSKGMSQVAELIELDHGGEFEQMSELRQRHVVHKAILILFSKHQFNTPLALVLARMVHLVSEWDYGKNERAGGVKEAILDVFDKRDMTKETREHLRQLGNRRQIVMSNMVPTVMPVYNKPHIDQVVAANYGTVDHYNK